jgi:hypothetical protein
MHWWLLEAEHKNEWENQISEYRVLLCSNGNALEPGKSGSHTTFWMLSIALNDPWTEAILMYMFSIFRFLFSFFYFVIFYIYLHVYPPPHSSSLSPPTIPASEQNLFCPLVLQFCWREIIGNSKKDTVFLLVWDKDSYTEREGCFQALVYFISWSPSQSGLCQFKITLFALHFQNLEIHC